MKKIINIFLASSISELVCERMTIENFIRNISDGFEEHYDVKVRPLLCENFDDAYTKIRKQEEYNDKIRNSEFCFFVFFTKVGQYTREEFEVARKSFEEIGKPKIYIYFKEVEEGEAEQSIYDFMQELDKLFGHYYGRFVHIDTVKLRILLSLKLHELDFLEIKTDDGKCVVDGVPVMELANVSEFANNGELQKLQKELEAVEEEYYKCKPIYAKGGCDSEFYSHYSKIAARRQSIIDEMEELQKLIFNVSLRMIQDDARGEITQRQKEAYRLFELGDYEGCMAVLDSDEIDDDFLRERQRIKEQDIAVCRKYIREHKTAIDILMAMTAYNERFVEIEKRYEKIVPIIFEHMIELGTAFDFLEYLYDQNDDKKAIEIAEKLNSSSLPDKAKKADVSNCLALLYNRQNQVLKAEEYYLQAIGMREELARESPERFNPDLAMSYSSAGVFYKDQGDAKKAEGYYLKAIGMYTELARENPKMFNPNLAMSYNNVGVFYKKQGNAKKAEGYYLRAMEIREALARENSERFNPYLAASYNNAGNFYYDQGDVKKAEEYHLQAIGMREELVRENPERFNPDLAESYNNAGVFYADQGDAKKAEEYYLQTIGIYTELARENPERFNPYLAASYNNAGAFYDGDQDDAGKAEEYYLRAIEIREELARESPKRFNPDLAASYNNAGLFYDDVQGDAKKAEGYYLKAIEIYTEIVRENPEQFNSDLADTYNNAGVFFAGQGDVKKAEGYFLKAIGICTELAQESPERFNPYLAQSYYNYAKVTGDEKFFAQALSLAKKHPGNYMCKWIIAALKK